MKVVAYSIRPFEKEFLAKANQKKHDITLISNPLNIETANFANGKDAIIVFTNDDVSAPVIDKLAEQGVKYIVTRSVGTDHIDKEAAAKYAIKLSNVPSYSPEAIAEHAVALAMALSRNIIKANNNSRHFDFRSDGLIGFNFHGKTAGIIGLGETGLAAARIFAGLGCNVIGYDKFITNNDNQLSQVGIDQLLAESDIISLHIPFTPDSAHLINKAAFDKMKHGVMLINTSRGAVIKTSDLLMAMENGKIGYLGMDVYEYEKGLFFENHQHDKNKDPLLSYLLERNNVIITPHQAYLTREALQEIANQTINNLDMWQQNKCVGKACVCAKNCRVAGLK